MNETYDRPPAQAGGIDWYLAFLLLTHHGSAEPDDTIAVRSCAAIVQAPTPDLAFSRSIDLGRRLVSETDFAEWDFVGIEDLLPRHEAPRDGVEILWSEEEMTPDEVAQLVKPGGKLAALQIEPTVNSSGWYAARIILEEVHDTGSHGPRSLVWINSYLIRADSPEAAYRRSLEIGRAEQEAGSHRCDGDTAHWEFLGLQDLLATRAAPADGAVLWYDEFRVRASQIPALTSDKAQLSAFRRSGPVLLPSY